MGRDWKDRYETEAILFVVKLILWRVVVVALKLFGTDVGLIGSFAILGLLFCIHYAIRLLFAPEA